MTIKRKVTRHEQTQELVQSVFKNKHDYASAVEGKFKLTGKHLKRLAKLVSSSNVQIKLALLIIHENKGYKFYKCKSFKDYVQANFTITYDAALKQVWAAKVAYVVNGVDAIGFFSDNSMLAMKGLSNEQIEDVVEEIESEHGDDVTMNGKYTRKMVEAAMRELGLTANDIDDESVSEEDEGEDTKPIAKAKQQGSKSTPKLSSNVKQSNIEEDGQSKNHRQFLKQFQKQAAKCKSSKAIITAFIKTDAGKKPKNVKKAIKLLTKHLQKLEA
ncbi:hypothetical protein [Shewanella phaeophyticola]|uniref:Uncharacterized protein n=1 Tax=Shewanella phaeophyticola TaxID=2978345 RepID=A0ABT2NYP6_9GAMM|nr:hypothetical protein [Shewanella sp. KJ10-1]MCT8985281.1 hypothetical protein [Shewanella sp. KJ10-1]